MTGTVEKQGAREMQYKKKGEFRSTQARVVMKIPLQGSREKKT